MNKKKLLTELSKFKDDNSKALWMVEHIQKLEDQFEVASYKIEDKCQKLISDFFDGVLDIPIEIKKYASIGMRYSTFIDRFKSKIALDDCLISSETKELLLASKHEIQKLRNVISKTTRSTSQIKKDMWSMENQIYMYEQIQLLETDAMKGKAKQLCENVTQKFRINEILRKVKRDAKKQNRIKKSN